jgi:hypothetical protein
LKPYLSAQVLQAKPDSVDKILEVARLAELTMPKTVLMAFESVIYQRLAEMQADMHRLSTKVDKAVTTSIESRSPTPERRVRFARSASPESPRHEAPTASYRGRQSGFQRVAYNEEQRLNIPDHARGVLEMTVRTLFVWHVIRERFAITVANPVIFKLHVYQLRSNIDGVAAQLPTMGSLLRRVCSENSIAVWSQRIASPKQ